MSPSNLSPLASRLSEALKSIAVADPRMAMVIRGFARHMERSPIPDSELVGGLQWIEEMVHYVMTGEQKKFTLYESVDRILAAEGTGDSAVSTSTEKYQAREVDIAEPWGSETVSV